MAMVVKQPTYRAYQLHSLSPVYIHFLSKYKNFASLCVMLLIQQGEWFWQLLESIPLSCIEGDYL